MKKLLLLLLFVGSLSSLYLLHNGREDEVISTNKGVISDSVWQNLLSISNASESVCSLSLVLFADSAYNENSLDSLSSYYFSKAENYYGESDWGGLLFLENGECIYAGSESFQKIADTYRLDRSLINVMQEYDASGVEKAFEMLLVVTLDAISNSKKIDINSFFINEEKNSVISLTGWLALQLLLVVVALFSFTLLLISQLGLFSSKKIVTDRLFHVATNSKRELFGISHIKRVR